MEIKDEKLTFEERDVLDCTTLGEIIAEWVRTFKQVHENHPFKGVPNHYLPEGVFNVDEQMVEEGEKQYHRDLAKIIFAFDNDEPEIADDVLKLIDDKIQVVDYSAWRAYDSEVEEHERKVQEGLDLFGTLYGTMWI